LRALLLISIVFFGGLIILVFYIAKSEMSARNEMKQLGALGDLRVSIATYKEDIGYFPAGSNKEITQQLLGQNPLHRIYLNSKLIEISTSGEALDQDGAPYVFLNTTNGLEVTSKNFHESDP